MQIMTNYKWRCQHNWCHHDTNTTTYSSRNSTHQQTFRQKLFSIFCQKNLLSFQLKKYFFALQFRWSWMVSLWWTGHDVASVSPTSTQGRAVDGQVCGRWEGSGKYVSLQDTRTRREGRATARHPPKQYRQGCLIKGKWFFSNHRGCLLATTHIFID